ncbi:MAG: YqgE/AlgH family protein [Acidobacteria bacterium]|nr:YqgE/AlgH family protein [Acidobacteriota bacterium]
MHRAAILALYCAVLAAQDTPVPAPGNFLVAKRALGDPNFIQTVILVVQYSKESAMGLVINDPSDIPMAKLFSGIKGSKDSAGVLYFGGPVQRSGAQALLRSKTKPADARHVFEDVYVTGSSTLLEKTIESGAKPDTFRIYLGYSGWGPGQLDREIEAGAWHVVKGDAGSVFDPNPGSIWERMIRRAQVRYAGTFPR